eukprot:6584278-Alexandrium_andersonii.AAC.1
MCAEGESLVGGKPPRVVVHEVAVLSLAAPLPSKAWFMLNSLKGDKSCGLKQWKLMNFPHCVSGRRA